MARRPLAVVASLVFGAPALGVWASVVEAVSLVPARLRGVFLDQGIELCSLHSKADS